MISLTSPMMVLVLALIVSATGALPAAASPVAAMEAAGRRLGRLSPWLVPALFTGVAVLLGWVNAPDLLVVATSVWLLAGCLTLPGPGDAEAPLLELLTTRFVAPLFFYVLVGVPGAVLYRAVHATQPRGALPAWLLGLVPGRLAAGALVLAGKLRGRAPEQRQDAPAPAELDEAWRTARLAAWIAAAFAALVLYPRHAFVL